MTKTVDIYKRKILYTMITFSARLSNYIIIYGSDNIKNATCHE